MAGPGGGAGESGQQSGGARSAQPRDDACLLYTSVEGVAPEAVRIGMAVRAQVAVKEGRGLLVFVPNKEAQ